MNTYRSFLDGRDPRVRFSFAVVLSLALIFLVALVLFRDSVGGALGLAVAVTVVAQAVRAYQLRTWPWRDPKVNDD